MTTARFIVAGVLAPSDIGRGKPREHLRAQRFLDSYHVAGNVGEQTMQAGNAVPVNVAHWIGTQLLEVLA